MARRRHSNVATFKAEAGADLGPSLRLRADGRYVHWGGAARVEIETRDDPEVVDRRRAVRGARRRDALADLVARRVITKRMSDAAEQFLEDCSIASGGTSADSVGMPSVAGPSAGLPERQLNAIIRIRAVRRLFNLEPGTIFYWCVFENRALGDFEAQHRLRNGFAAGLLREVLDALDDHYHRNTAR